MKHLLILIALAASAQQIKINPITGLPDLVGGGSGTGAAPYGAAVAAQTTLTVAAATHLQGTDPIATCYEGTSPFIATACYYTKATNGDIVFTWSPAFTGRVVIIGGGTGATGATGATGPAGATGPTGAATFTADARTGTTEALVSADCGQAVTFSNAGAIAVSLPASPLADGCTIAVKNIGAGDVTITPVSGTISGAASVVMSTGENSWITSNGTNYEAQTVHLTVDSALSITRSRTSQQIGVGATVATLSGTQTLTNKDLSSATNSIGPNAIKAYVAGGGTAQAQTATLSPALPAYVAGGSVCWLPIAANTGAAPTLNVNGLGAKNITKLGTTALVANDLTTTAVACAIYDGTQYQLQNPQVAAGGGGYYIMQAGTNGVRVLAFAHKYYQLTGIMSEANEADNAIYVSNSVTASKLCIATYYDDQPSSGSLVFTLRKDTGGDGVFVDTSVVVTVPANGTDGNYCDTTHSASIAAGDRVSLRAVNNATADSAYFYQISLKMSN